MGKFKLTLVVDVSVDDAEIVKKSIENLVVDMLDTTSFLTKKDELLVSCDIEKL